MEAPFGLVQFCQFWVAETITPLGTNTCTSPLKPGGKKPKSDGEFPKNITMCYLINNHRQTLLLASFGW
jgi:hypothetical protein